MTTELRDDAFDLDVLVLADMPFAAYYPVEVADERPTGVGPWRFFPEIPFVQRRRRWTYVGHGGMQWGGSAPWEFRPEGIPARVWDYVGSGGLTWLGEAVVWFTSPLLRKLDWHRRDENDLMDLDIL